MSLGTQPFGTAPFDAKYDVLESTTLQCTNMVGGNNKFIVAELHKDASGRIRIYTCYGRTGGPTPAKEERIAYSEVEGRKEYNSYIHNKTTRKKDPYRKVEMASTSQGTDVGNAKILSSDVKVKTTTSTTTSIDSVIANLVTRLYNAAGQACQSQLQGSLSTSAKNPLGTLTLGQIKCGEDILAAAQAYFATNPTAMGTVNPKIISFTNDFYSAIPQNLPLRPKDTGGREKWLAKFCLNQPKILIEKADLLEMLADVKGMIQGFDSNDIGVKYQQMNCEVRACTSAETKYAKEYMEGSQSSRHSWGLRFQEAWAVTNKHQHANDPVMDKVGNVKELFHGSRAGNILGICKSGLIIRNPGTVSAGLMFGNGIYFADKSTKSSQYASAGYTYGSQYNDNSCYMFIAQVALGKMMEYQTAQGRLVAAPAGYDSVKGCAGYSLVHNEYIIYRPQQHKLKFLCRFIGT